MQWLRSRPDDLDELNEAQRYAEEGGYEDSDEETMGGVPRATHNMGPPRRRGGTANGGSPMSVEPNGEPFE